MSASRTLLPQSSQHIEKKRIILYVFANSKINRTKIEHKVEFLKATIIPALDGWHIPARLTMAVVCTLWTRLRINGALPTAHC